MSQVVHNNDAAAKAIAIPLVFSENSQAKNMDVYNEWVSKDDFFFFTTSEDTKDAKIWMFIMNGYLKVPLSTSCPLSLTWVPSLSREPNAIASAIAQSTTLFSTICNLDFRILLKPKNKIQNVNLKERQVFLFHKI